MYQDKIIGMKPKELHIGLDHMDKTTIKNICETDTVICTDGAVKQYNDKYFEISGYALLENNILQATEVCVHGKGNKSYQAESNAISKVLSHIMELDTNRITLLTDCQSLLRKLETWMEWDTKEEATIAPTIKQLCERNVAVHLHYVKMPY